MYEFNVFYYSCFFILTMLWRIDPLLGRDLEAKNGARAGENINSIRAIAR
jgi:hypothetical protein